MLALGHWHHFLDYSLKEHLESPVQHPLSAVALMFISLSLSQAPLFLHLTWYLVQLLVFRTNSVGLIQLFPLLPPLTFTTPDQQSQVINPHLPSRGRGYPEQYLRSP